MKYSLAIVALLGVASAIKIRAEPAAAAATAPAAPAAPAKDAKVDVDAKAAAAAGKPEAPAADPLNPGKAVVAEALKTDE